MEWVIGYFVVGLLLYLGCDWDQKRRGKRLDLAPSFLIMTLYPIVIIIAILRRS